MGDPTNEGYPSERLIVVSPFFVNAHEVTVGELRARRGATLFEPLRRGVNDQCSYTTQPGANEALPVTCIARARAASYCAQTGGALISEAQWEYLARGRRSAAYPWGDDVPQCADAVFDRKTTSATCGKTGVGPSPAGQGTRDRVGDVVDLAGNVMEWMADEWAKDTETCWRAPLLYDPVCRQPGTADGPSLALRGGNWSDLAALMHGAYRQHVPTTMAVTVSDTVGFRCARPL
jgi:formylglycine-generating enzyme required for sulfatase activity